MRLIELKAVLGTTRPLSSTLLFLTVAVGFVLSGRSLNEAFANALPMLSIAAAGFCVNDIFDQETDRINHPDRALIKHPALSSGATTVYVCLFAFSIGIIVAQGEWQQRFIWAMFFLLISNYSQFKRSFPIAKNTYIAVSACVVVSILDIAHDGELSSIFLYAPFFAAVFARELACDIPDSAGDTGTIALKLGHRWSFIVVISIYLAALIATWFISAAPIQMVVAAAGTVALGMYGIGITWHNRREKHLALLSGMIAITPSIVLIT